MVGLKEPIDLRIRLQIERNHDCFIKLRKTFKHRCCIHACLKCESYCLFLLGYKGFLPVPEALLAIFLLLIYIYISIQFFLLQENFEIPLHP